ncbi:uncharacterized protein with FMN-binding domain [Orenia metallireducens]|uniref:Uncharacterized protein, contains FMN-binding domain n=1 Tax=Orenia metallireducens TaxID=1413210 RepID=A0A285HI43_9FIRM|nr:FMN-binding protein [Orenia metallireducens]PRX27214.1 uncharacterized protein with FMN-binding domain [Orenia metallireducens]SNY35409.1 Uncharacterized protein, contains FMN-binding domain [Orenia metallireducens]
MRVFKLRDVLYLFLVLIIAMSLTGCRELEDIEINDINLEEIDDGQYIGEYTTTLVAAKVVVKVEEHKLISIDILEHRNGRGQKAERIVDSVIRQQKLKVDVISGATGSSKVILKAIEKALSK